MSAANPQQRLAAARQTLDEALDALGLTDFQKLAVRSAAQSLGKAMADGAVAAAVADLADRRAGHCEHLGP